MRKLIALISILISNTVMAQLAVGERIPDFSLLNQNGDTVTTASLLGHGPIVIYFYPKDDTPGCTREACSFRDSYEVFEDAGARVIGVSADSSESHLEFGKKHNLPFTLLSDTSNVVRKAFGVKGDLFGLIPGRVTFVMDENGIIQHVFDSQTRSSAHVDESLEAIRKLKSSEE